MKSKMLLVTGILTLLLTCLSGYSDVKVTTPPTPPFPSRCSMFALLREAGKYVYTFYNGACPSMCYASTTKNIMDFLCIYFKQDLELKSVSDYEPASDEERNNPAEVTQIIFLLKQDDNHWYLARRKNADSYDGSSSDHILTPSQQDGIQNALLSRYGKYVIFVYNTHVAVYSINRDDLSIGKTPVIDDKVADQEEIDPTKVFVNDDTGSSGHTLTIMYDVKVGGKPVYDKYAYVISDDGIRAIANNRIYHWQQDDQGNLWWNNGALLHVETIFIGCEEYYIGCIDYDFNHGVLKIRNNPLSDDYIVNLDDAVGLSI